MSFGKLIEIWFGNFIGTGIVANLIYSTPIGIELRQKAMEIIDVRLANGFGTNLICGVLCGILMYVAVSTFATSGGKPIYAIMPVAIFILSGLNHCVADMFYTHLGSVDFVDYITLIPTTIGNFIGCNIIPLFMRVKE